MNYDKNSFLSGVAVGRQLNGWGVSANVWKEPGIFYGNTVVNNGIWPVSQQATYYSDSNGWGATQKALVQAFVDAVSHTALGQDCDIVYVETDTSAQYIAHLYFGGGFYIRMSNQEMTTGVLDGSQIYVETAAHSLISTVSFADLVTDAVGTSVTVRVYEGSNNIIRITFAINGVEQTINSYCFMRISGTFTGNSIICMPTSLSGRSPWVMLNTSDPNMTTIPVYSYAPEYYNKAIQGKAYAIPCFAVPNDASDYYSLAYGNPFYVIPTTATLGVTGLGGRSIISINGKRFALFFANGGTNTDNKKWGQLAVAI